MGAEKIVIYKWEDIQEFFNQKLILGNGASIAIWDKFSYDSLLQQAISEGFIKENLIEVFNKFKTQDFERVLRLLLEAYNVNMLLGIQENMTFELYKNLRNSLIRIIRVIHPEHDSVKDHLLLIARFMKKFETVINLNYDLMVYWAMMDYLDKHPYSFKDAFIHDGKFESDFEFLRRPYGKAKSPTLVFYPHGNLILATELFGNEIKLYRANEEIFLLKNIMEKWEQDNCTPLFISEGTTEEKLQAIKRSDYLDTVYDSVLKSPTVNAVTFGWSFRDEDDHIIRALVEGGIGKLAVSVYTEAGASEEYCNWVKYKIEKIHRQMHRENKCDIMFFDASSKACWNNCE